MLGEEDKPTAVALGYFDGVHLGHQKIINTAVEVAKKNGYKSVVHTFYKSPKVFMGKVADNYLITPIEEKMMILEEMNVDIVMADDFDEKYANINPETFVKDVLKKRLGAKIVVAGYHYRFGKKASADANDLKLLCANCGIECIIIPSITLNGEEISSTKIREYFAMGKILMVNKLLGYEYFVVAEVVKGKQLGRTIGFPTINQRIKKNSLPLKKGVYITRVYIDDNKYLGLTNVGNRPSVEDGAQKNMETYIFNINRDLYGKKIKVEFLKRLREEIKFDSVEKLKEQIELDREAALEFEKNAR